MDPVIVKFAKKHQKTVFKGIPKSVKKRLNFILHKINFSRYTLIEQRFFCLMLKNLPTQTMKNIKSTWFTGLAVISKYPQKTSIYFYSSRNGDT